MINRFTAAKRPKFAAINKQSLARVVGIVLAGVLTPTLQGADVATAHYDPQRTGWNFTETELTPERLSSGSFRAIWESPQLDVVGGLPPRIYASPLYIDKVEMSSGSRKGMVFPVVFVASSNGFVYAVNASTDTEDPGAILWRTDLGRFARSPRGAIDGVNMGVQSTPVIDVLKKIIYVTSCGADHEWKVYAIDITSGQTLPNWPISIGLATVNAPGINQNAPAPVPPPPAVSGQPAAPARPGRPSLGVQRAALNLSPDGTRLYLGFGESTTGWTVAVDTTKPEVATAFASVANAAGNTGGVWGAGGPALDEQGNVFVSTGSDFGGFKNQPHDWTQSVLKLSDSKELGFVLRGTYSPFNYAATAANDIDLGSGGICIIPALDPASTQTPYLMALTGKQGNIYLVNRDQMPGKLDWRPAVSEDSETDQSLLSPRIQPQFGKRGPINLFGPYTEKSAAVNQARSRSVPAYFRGADGTSYLFAAGHSKKTEDSIVNVPPCLVRLKIVQSPGRPAYLEIDQEEKTLVFENPGHPVVTSNGSHGAVVWILDENAIRSTTLNGEDSPRPVLYAFDALTFMLLWRSRPNELHTSGKYNEPTIINGRVFVGTDRIQAFGVRKSK